MSLSAPLPLTIGDLLDCQADSRGSHPLLVCDSQTLTYAEASQRSAALARGLIASGLAQGSRVGLIYPNGPDFFVASAAAARIGAISVPISTFSTATEVQTLMNNAVVNAVLATPGYRRHDYVQVLSESVPELDLDLRPPLASASVPSLRQIAFASSDDGIDASWTVQSLLEQGDRISSQVLRASQTGVKPSDRLVIVHTSGSTAQPKGVIHTHGSLISHLRVLNELRRFGEEEILFCNSPFFWIGGFAYALMGTLVAGATLICSNAADASGVLDVIERSRPTMVNGFAQSVAHLPADPSFPQRDLSSIKRGNLYCIMPDSIRPVDPELHHNMLGMTEAGSVCLASDDIAQQPEYRRGSFGRPVPDMEAKVTDPESGAMSAVGDIGELCLRGPALMEGYCGVERFGTFDPDGWYHTGDLFHLDEEGYFYFHGRQGEMIKTSGANVSPREVEVVILEETGLMAHVFGIDDAVAGQLVAAAIVVPPTAETPDSEVVTSQLSARLSAYKVPKRILIINASDTPVTSSGKLDLRTLKERVRDG